MLDFPVVDAHMHLWDLQEISYPWLTPPLPIGIAGNISPIAKTYLPAHYFADVEELDSHYRVAKAVHIEAGANPMQSLLETQWLQRLADERGFPQAIVAHADLSSPRIESFLIEQTKNLNVRGIRQTLNWHADSTKSFTTHNLFDDDAWHKGFSFLREFELSFDMQIYPWQMPAAAQLARCHPETLVILNHAGMPIDRDVRGVEEWDAGMEMLASQSNVVAKISGLGMVDWHWTTDSLRPFVTRTIDCFGPNRCLFASNFPVDRLFGSFARTYAAYDDVTSDYRDDERRAMFVTNAERVYRI